MIEHEVGCSKRHRGRQRCDEPAHPAAPAKATDTPPPPTNAQPTPELLAIDWGRVQSCLIALPIVMPFVVIVVAFSGDSGSDHVPFTLVMTLTILVAAFLVATYALLTVIDWIGKHI